MVNQTKGETEEKIQLDSSLADPKDRNKLVHKIINNTPVEQLSSKYLVELADYILKAQTPKEKKRLPLLTTNKMVTVNKREVSYEGLVKKFENGEDAVYHLIRHDKNIIFRPKILITQQDLVDIPELRQLYEAIQIVKAEKNQASGYKRSVLLKTLIEMRRDQYVIKNAFRRPIYFLNIKKNLHKIDFWEKIVINTDGSLSSDGISLLDPNTISLLLCNYGKLKEDTWDQLDNDARYMILDLENLIDKTLKEKYPLYFDLLVYKIDKLTNEEIQVLLLRDHGIKHSIEYISSLWRKKIPKLLAEQAQKDYLTWYYTEKEKGKWKKCSRCGQIKLAHNLFFSKNKTSKDGFYSICKECRNKKK